jgi:hypothetical protein
MPATWQQGSDDGHQQRYLPDRQAVLRHVHSIGPMAASKRFEVDTESEPVTPADGQPGGRTFTLAEVTGLGRPGETERLQTELFRSANAGKESVRKGLPSRPESRTFDTGRRPLPRRTL